MTDTILIPQSAGTLHTMYMNGQILRQCYYNKSTGGYSYQYFWISAKGEWTTLTGIRQTKVSIPTLERAVKKHVGTSPQKVIVTIPIF